MNWTSRIPTVALAVLFGATLGMAQSSDPTQNSQRGQGSTSQQDRSTARQSSTSSSQAGQQETLTGCVEKGAGSSQFTLKTDSGDVWTIMGSNLDSHVGHTVTVTGNAQRASASSGTSSGTSGGYGAAGQSGTATSSGTYGQSGTGSASAATSKGQLDVSQVTMVSTSCQSGGGLSGGSSSSRSGGAGAGTSSGTSTTTPSSR